MTSCPKCGSIEMHTHGARSHVDFVKRWRWFGPVVPRGTPVALNVSCANCLYAFIVRHGGQSPAPLQSAHDDLARLQAGIKQVEQGKDRTSSDDDKPVARPVAPRPAPDPRAKRR